MILNEIFLLFRWNGFLHFSLFKPRKTKNRGLLIEETVVGLVPLGSVIHLLDALLVLLLIHNDEQLKVVDLIHGGCDKSLLSTEVDKCHLRCDIPRSAAHNHLHLNTLYSPILQFLITLLQAAADNLPVHNLPQGSEVVRAAVLIV